MKYIIIFSMIIIELFVACKMNPPTDSKVNQLNDSIKYHIKRGDNAIKEQDSLYNILDSLGYDVNWDSIKRKRRLDSIRKVREFGL